MRRILGLLPTLAVVAVAAAVLCLPGVAGAEDFGLDEVCQNAPDSAACSSAEEDGYAITGANGILARAANLMAIVAGAVAVIMVIIASFQFVTAAGDSGKISSAKKTLTWAIAGVVVIVMARTIVVFVVSRL